MGALHFAVAVTVITVGHIWSVVIAEEIRRGETLTFVSSSSANSLSSSCSYERRRQQRRTAQTFAGVQLHHCCYNRE